MLKDGQRSVKPEATGWRDEEISRWHRDLGWDFPALDIDFLMAEYDQGKPRALIEYKSWNAPEVRLSHPSFLVIRTLADAAKIPAFICRYWLKTAPRKFKVGALNVFAKKILPQVQELSEEKFIELLKRVRSEPSK